MSYPVLLTASLSVWRGDPYSTVIRCWRDTAKTEPVDLTTFGSSWSSSIRASYESSALLGFDIDTSLAQLGQLTLSLDDNVTASDLPLPYYVFDVQALGGGIAPLTVFLGRFSVDGTAS